MKIFFVAGLVTLKKMMEKRMGESLGKKKEKKRKTNAQINSQPVKINEDNAGTFLETLRVGSPEN